MVSDETLEVIQNIPINILRPHFVLVIFFSFLIGLFIFKNLNMVLVVASLVLACIVLGVISWLTLLNRTRKREQTEKHIHDGSNA